MLSLSSLDTSKAREKIASAIGQQMPVVGELRTLTKSLKVLELNSRQCLTVTPVASDGGANKIIFEPLNLEILRVVDSQGKEHILEIIPLSSDPAIYKRIFNEIDCLRHLMERLGVEYEDISDYLPKKDSDPHIYDPKIAVSTLREIIEWAVLLDIAWSETRSQILLLRDGLLKTRKFKRTTIEKLSSSFEQANKENGCMLLGIAKKPKVVSYLSLALVLEKPFNRSFPCFCEVPEAIEHRTYKHASDWLIGYSFGKLHIAKLTSSVPGLLLPVDVPPWLMRRRKEVLEYLVSTAKVSFPKIGYPYPLIQAHEHATLGQFEMSFLSDFVVEAVLSKHPKEEKMQILQHIAFGNAIEVEGF
ncbi:MAG: hypothetical protein IBX64_05720 [Actinobacteria bacterium]|nr:hypothetical protein [Actinomycetota bacterium]